jgi:hypothetical protein
MYTGPAAFVATNLFPFGERARTTPEPDIVVKNALLLRSSLRIPRSDPRYAMFPSAETIIEFTVGTWLLKVGKVTGVLVPVLVSMIATPAAPGALTTTFCAVGPVTLTVTGML